MLAELFTFLFLTLFFFDFDFLDTASLINFGSDTTGGGEDRILMVPVFNESSSLSIALTSREISSV